MLSDTLHAIVHGGSGVVAHIGHVRSALPDDLFSVTSGVGLALAFGGVVAVGAMPRFKTAKYRSVRAAAGGLLAFQVFHLLEHLIQLSYWVMHPDASPYMTPWAMTGAEGLGLWAAALPGAGGDLLRGMEFLHLIGNVLFLAGLVALHQVARRAQPAMQLPGMRVALVAQSVHVAEHVLLTGSVLLVGEPIGLSTLFGYGNAMAWGASVRVWFHFLINLLGTVPAAIAFTTYMDEDAYRNAIRRFEPAHAGGYVGLLIRR